MKRLGLFLIIVLLSYGCERFGCADLLECEEILPDTFAVNLFRNGEKIDTITARTTQNGDSVVINHTLPDCPDMPQILPDTFKVDIFDQRTQELLASQHAVTERNGQRIERQAFVTVPPDTVLVELPPDTVFVELPPDTVIVETPPDTITVPAPIVDERYVIGPGRHSATTFKLCNYKIDDSNDSEFGRNVELFEDQTEGQIEAWFKGSAAAYRMMIKLESDAGVTNVFSLWINGQQVEEWSLAGGDKDKQTEVTTTVDIPAVAWLEIRVSTTKTEDAGEIDVVEISQM